MESKQAGTAIDRDSQRRRLLISDSVSKRGTPSQGLGLTDIETGYQTTELDFQQADRQTDKKHNRLHVETLIVTNEKNAAKNKQ